MDMEKTGTYLASLRRGRDMTQQQVADILGVSNKTVSKWESGAGLPDIAALPALAALYGVTADDIPAPGLCRYTSGGGGLSGAPGKPALPHRVQSGSNGVGSVGGISL